MQERQMNREYVGFKNDCIQRKYSLQQKRTTTILSLQPKNFYRTTKGVWYPMDQQLTNQAVFPSLVAKKKNWNRKKQKHKKHQQRLYYHDVQNRKKQQTQNKENIYVEYLHLENIAERTNMYCTYNQQKKIVHLQKKRIQQYQYMDTFQERKYYDLVIQKYQKEQMLCRVGAEKTNPQKRKDRLFSSITKQRQSSIYQNTTKKKRKRLFFFAYTILQSRICDHMDSKYMVCRNMQQLEIFFCLSSNSPLVAIKYYLYIGAISTTFFI